MDITVDLRANRVTVSVDGAAPREGRAATRVNWLVRQLRDAPDGLRIDAYATGSRTSTSELLRAVRENPAALVGDPKRDLRTFRVAASSPMGTKRGTGRGGFIDSVLTAVDGFYEHVVQQLRPWAAKAPQLPAGGRSAAEEAGIDIEPPPGDLAEADDAELPGDAPPSDAPPPAAVIEGVEQADTATEPPVVPAPVSPEEMVSWDGAQERLDHERVAVDADGVTVS